MNFLLLVLFFNIYLPPAYIVRGKVLFSQVSVCPHPRGVPTFWVGGYLPSQVWTGGYPLPWWGGDLPSQVWMGGTYLPTSGWGGGYLPTFQGLDGWVPTFQGLDGGYLPSQVWPPTQSRYPPTQGSTPCLGQVPPPSVGAPPVQGRNLPPRVGTAPPWVGTPTQCRCPPPLRVGTSHLGQVPPHLGQVPPTQGRYPPYQYSMACACHAAGGMPLAFTQEDCFAYSLKFQYGTEKVNQSLTFHCGCGKDCLETYVCFKMIGKIHYSNGNHSKLMQIYATYDEILRYNGQVRVQQLLLRSWSFLRGQGPCSFLAWFFLQESCPSTAWDRDPQTPAPTARSKKETECRTRLKTLLSRCNMQIYVVIFSLIEELIQNPPLEEAFTQRPQHHNNKNYAIVPSL